jgi:cyclohexadienyl dehydratase
MRWWRVILLASVVALAPVAGAASGPLRVGTSGDYAPFSVVDAEGRVSGFDIAVAQAYAADRGRDLRLVPFRWPGLLADLETGRFDVVMSGVTVRPERSAAGRFTVPVASSGAVVLLRNEGSLRRLDDLDREGVRVAVNAGGHLERVTRARFPRAAVVAIADNAAVRQALHDDGIDAVVTDTTEAPAWLRSAPGWRAHGPFTRDRKAYLLRADQGDLARDLDGWILERERDGTLGRLRWAYLPPAATGVTATPLAALLAAVDERLALMPLIGATKRAADLPVDVPERETIVLDGAVASVRAAATRARTHAPTSEAIRGFFAAQIAAAKEIQTATATGPHAVDPLPVAELTTVLRPALTRIGARIAGIIIILPADLDGATVRPAADVALRAPGLSDRSRERISAAIVRVSRSRSAVPGSPHSAGGSN